jgi:hypothetical protein
MARAIAQRLDRGKLSSNRRSDERFDELCVELRALMESRPPAAGARSG